MPSAVRTGRSWGQVLENKGKIASAARSRGDCGRLVIDGSAATGSSNLLVCQRHSNASKCAPRARFPSERDPLPRHALPPQMPIAYSSLQGCVARTPAQRFPWLSSRSKTCRKAMISTARQCGRSWAAGPPPRGRSKSIRLRAAVAASSTIRRVSGIKGRHQRSLGARRSKPRSLTGPALVAGPRQAAESTSTLPRRRSAARKSTPGSRVAASSIRKVRSEDRRFGAVRDIWPTEPKARGGGQTGVESHAQIRRGA
jgi:hypothetical protein